MKDFLISSTAAKLRAKFVMRCTSALFFSAYACVAADLPANLREDIDAGNQAWVDGLRAGDANRVVSGFAQDSVNCNAAGDCVKGLMAVAAQYKEVIARFGLATSGFVRSETLHVDHDLAYESGYAEVHFLNAAVLKGRFSTVWKRQEDGHWKIFRNISLPAPPSPQTHGDSEKKLMPRRHVNDSSQRLFE